jgi:hypothetical protein
VSEIVTKCSIAFLVEWVPRRSFIFGEFLRVKLQAFGVGDSVSWDFIGEIGSEEFSEWVESGLIVGLRSFSFSIKLATLRGEVCFSSKF